VQQDGDGGGGGSVGASGLQALPASQWVWGADASSGARAEALRRRVRAAGFKTAGLLTQLSFCVRAPCRYTPAAAGVLPHACFHASLLSTPSPSASPIHRQQPQTDRPHAHTRSSLAAGVTAPAAAVSSGGCGQQPSQRESVPGLELHKSQCELPAALTSRCSVALSPPALSRGPLLSHARCRATSAGRDGSSRTHRPPWQLLLL
jgi:hypothetical protein